jgi:glyoxylase-like metal-dependent hydrolase (beta-lactamase superfamily II)
MNEKKLWRVLAPLVGVILAVGLCGAVALFLRRPAARQTDADDDRFSTTLIRQPCRVGDGIYLLGDMSPSAVYVIDTAEGMAMIDSGLAERHQSLVDGLTALGLDVRRLKMILLTHAHGDHTMGADLLRRESGAKIYIGREDAGPLREGGQQDAVFSKFDMPDAEIRPLSVDGELVDGQAFDLGDARITAIATPGHTAGSFCYLLTRQHHRVLFTGDTVMTLGNGLGTYSAYLPPRYRGHADDYLASRVTPSRWRGLLDGGIEELERLTARRARDGADFLDGTPTEIAADLFYLGNLEDHAVYAWKTSRGALLFDAACGRGARQFVDTAWRELGIEPPPTIAVLLTSCQARNLADIRALVEATNCHVLASPAGIAAAKRACGEKALVSPSDEAARLGFEDVEAMPVPGRDETAVAYRFSIKEQRVLVTGDMPIEGEKSIASRLSQEMSHEQWDVDRFSESLDALAGLNPDIWLSAHPLFGRSANLYDQDWSKTISINRQLLREHHLAE